MVELHHLLIAVYVACEASSTSHVARRQSCSGQPPQCFILTFYHARVSGHKQVACRVNVRGDDSSMGVEFAFAMLVLQGTPDRSYSDKARVDLWGT